MFGSTLAFLREESGLTQAEVAAKLGVSRATYMNLENGSREPDLSELKKVSVLFEVGVADLIDEKPGNFGGKTVKEAKLAAEKYQIIPREVPSFQAEKLRELLLYLLQKVGAKPNIGETVLYKLLYFIDFDYYEKHGKSITGLTYVKNHYGPTPKYKSFESVIAAMKKRGELDVVSTRYFKHKQKKYLPVVEAELTRLSAQELEHINEEIERLSDKSAGELTDLSHKDTPWIATDNNKPINYQYVMYRTPITSVKEPEDEL